MSDEKNNIDSIVISEVQLILAEKRTSLAVMRTGIAVIVLPLSVMSVLIATSKYYDISHVLNFLVPLLVINLILIVFGAYLIIHSIIQMRHYDRFIKKLKRSNSNIGDVID